MARAYYGNKISENITQTPEGYLICLGVPIARSGWQEYTGDELGLDSDGAVQVYRDPKEVFDPATIASFEVKSVTHPHPPEWVTPYNEGAYGKGHVQNVRHGEGDKADLLIADLVVKDAVLIDMVKGGLREISCGYDCEYVPMAGGNKYAQTQIRGNHVAIVASGRAGERVSIRDSKDLSDPDNNKNNLQRRSTMKFWDWLKGATPDDLKEAGLRLTLDDDDDKKKHHRDDDDDKKKKDCRDDDDDDDKKRKGKDDDDDFKHVTDAIMARLDRIEEHIKPKAVDALDGLLAKLEGKHVRDDDDDDDKKRRSKDDDDDDKKRAKDDDKKKSKDDDDDDDDDKKKSKDAEVIEPVETLSGNEIPENPIPGADKKAVVDYVKKMRPIIARMKDEKEKKAAINALVSLFTPRKIGGSYADLMRPKDVDNRMQSMDAAAQKQAQVDEDYGKKIKEKYHRKPLVR